MLSLFCLYAVRLFLCRGCLSLQLNRRSVRWHRRVVTLKLLVIWCPVRSRPMLLWPPYGVVESLYGNSSVHVCFEPTVERYSWSRRHSRIHLLLCFHDRCIKPHMGIDFVNAVAVTKSTTRAAGHAHDTIMSSLTRLYVVAWAVARVVNRNYAAALTAAAVRSCYTVTQLCHHKNDLGTDFILWQAFTRQKHTHTKTAVTTLCCCSDAHCLTLLLLLCYVVLFCQCHGNKMEFQNYMT